MLRMKVVASLLTLVCALGAMATSAAAEETAARLLPGGSGTTFTGKSGKVTWQIKGGAAINCSSSTGEGELTGQSSGQGTIDFKGCSTAGLPINSLGDASGTVLASGEVTLCDISKGSVGVIVHLPSSGVHTEVPSTKLLLLKKGAFIIEASPVGKATTKFTGTLTQKEGQQTITKCEGGPERTLLISTDGGEFKFIGVEAKEDELVFKQEEELMA